MSPCPASPTGIRFILVIEDVYSRWVKAFPRPQVTAKEVVTTLEGEIFAHYGYPNIIITDNGEQFTSATFVRESWDAKIGRQRSTTLRPTQLRDATRS